MLHIIGQTDTALADAVLRNMFEARKRVFVDLLGWDVPVLAGRYELDQFDTPDAFYLVLAGADGSHRASTRLLATTSPHILDSLFAELCDGPVPIGPGIHEITRFCIDPGLDRRERRRARDELVHAIARFGVTQGISLYTGVAEPRWLAQILAFGWRCRLLGEPRQVGGARLGALAIEIDAGTPGLLEANGICGTAALTMEMRDAA